MAIVKIDHIFKLMREKELPYWRLTDNTGTRNMVAENDVEENVEKGIEMMQEALENIEDNMICVMLSNRTKKQKAGGGRNFTQMEFKINLHKAESGFNGGNTGMLALLLAQMEKNSLLTMQLMETKKESELIELRREMKELKAGGGAGAEKYFPYLNKIFGINDDSHGIAAAGDDDDAVNEAAVKKQERIRKALVRIAKVDPFLPDTLTLLANYAEKFPAKYKAAVLMLKDDLQKSK